jgi:2-phosphosulfolactate phosphatase
LDWGEPGLEAVGTGSGVIVVVDVLSFCTCVDVVTARGAAVLPYRWRDGAAVRYAQEQRAIVADGTRRVDAYSLSPPSLAAIPAATRLVLPSPNGAAVCLHAGEIGTTVAACLRNAAAVAEFARSRGEPVAVIGCGERWPDGSLRPCWEDLIGAGAVIAKLPGPWSPEAEAAAAAFRHAATDLPGRLRACSSGRELIERGFAADVEIAGAVGSSRCVPVLSGEAFVNSPS